MLACSLSRSTLQKIDPKYHDLVFKVQLFEPQPNLNIKYMMQFT